MQVGSLAIQPKELQFAKKKQYFSIQRGSVWEKKKKLYTVSCCLLCTVFGSRLELHFPTTKRFASEDGPLLCGLKIGGEEERHRKQSIAIDS